MSGDGASATGCRALRLAELVAARLCHDLSGPAGTASGALELAADDPSCNDEAIGTAGTAAQTMVRRLRLLRAAWTATGAALTPADIGRLASGLPSRGVEISLDGLAGDVVLGPKAGRLVLNLLLLAAESLPRGGLVTFASAMAGEVVVTIDGPNAAWPAGLGAWLADPQAAWDAVNDAAETADGARRLQGPLTALIAAADGMRVSMLMASGLAGGRAGPPPLLAGTTGQNEGIASVVI